MPDAKLDTDKKKSLKQSKELDKRNSFVATKVQYTLECNKFGAVNVIYS